MAEGACAKAQQADWEEDSLLRLYLTTLAGTVIQLHVPVSIYHTWEMLEEYLVEHLPCISPIETFGCELTLLNADTQVALQDPVQEELWNTNHFCLIVHECFRCLENNKPLFFFHEYGRRVGMVPRSSLKERKNNQMVEKRTKTTQQQTKPTKTEPTGRVSTIL